MHRASWIFPPVSSLYLRHRFLGFILPEKRPVEAVRDAELRYLCSKSDPLRGISFAEQQPGGVRSVLRQVVVSVIRDGRLPQWHRKPVQFSKVEPISKVKVRMPAAQGARYPGILSGCAAASFPASQTAHRNRNRLRFYSRLPYIATASSTVISPLPTWKAACRIWTVMGSRMPSISGEMVWSEGTWLKGA